MFLRAEPDENGDDQFHFSQYSILNYQRNVLGNKTFKLIFNSEEEIQALIDSYKEIAMEEGDEWADPALSPEEELVFSDDRRELRQTMSGVLSDFEFKVTTMYMDGMSYAEICHATGKGEKSVENAIQRSKRKSVECVVHCRYCKSIQKES